VQVLIGMAVGILIGALAPAWGVALKPVADGFVKLIKMLLAPIIFGTVAVGIAQMRRMGDVGRLGLKALVYFELLSTVALAFGLLAANLLRPGAGMNIDARTLDPAAIAGYATAAKHAEGMSGFLLGIIPDTMLSAFVAGNMLQVILVALLLGVALSGMGESAAPLVELIDKLTKAVFRIVGMVMRLAPLGAGAGIAYTIGKYGIATLLPLGYLLVVLYATAMLFVAVALGIVARLAGISLWALLRFIRDEIFIVFGTCSTEAVLPQLMAKLEALGCARPVVGLVLPAGYTFNTDGTSIYLAMAVVFIAQATNTPLSIGDELTIMAVLLLTSKGSAGVAGAGFVALAATLAVTPALPVAGLVLLLGVDRFLNQARAVVNLIGNSVATVAIARWDGALDLDRAKAVLHGAPLPDPVELAV
jgi:aerobic C4-dicarboxylate transport protein